jgi:16S rRNA (uracil1498-N3)-methyltransferase
MVALSADESHHLLHVLRVKTGDAVLAFDGHGREWRARVMDVDRSLVTLALIEPHVPVAEPPVAVTVAIGVLKGDQMSAAIRDATMLGAAAIVPFASDHTAVPTRGRHDRSIERWQRVAVASAKQCRRAVVPIVRAVCELDEVLAAEMGRRICCVEPVVAAGWSQSSAPGDRPMTATVCVGPEGGWSAGDLDCLRSRGATPLDLGPRTLRAETAPTVALTVLWSQWGWR